MKVNETQNLSVILERFQLLKKLDCSRNIYESEAFKFLIEEFNSKENEKMCGSIFAIISCNLIHVEKTKQYFEFIESLFISKRFEKSLLVFEIYNLSLHGLNNELSKWKFFYYLSVVTPNIISDILFENKSTDLHLYLRIMESIFLLNDSNLVRNYIETLKNVLEIYDDVSSIDLDLTLANHTNILRLCAQFPECDPDDVSYFSKLADFYDRH